MSTNAQPAASPEPDFEAIRKYLLIEETALCPADVILVFGNRHAIEQSAERAASLFQKGYAKKIIVSGGVLTNEGISEARAMFNAVSKRVPKENILIENQSTNTIENVVFSQQLLAQKQPDLDVKAVIGIGTIFAGRRFIATLNKYWNNILPMASNINPTKVAIDEWKNIPHLKDIAVNELSKIRYGLAHDEIDEIDIATINTRAHTQSTCPRIICW